MDSGKLTVTIRQGATRSKSGRRLRFDGGASTPSTPNMPIPRSSWFEPEDNSPRATDEEDRDDFVD